MNVKKTPAVKKSTKKNALALKKAVKKKLSMADRIQEAEAMLKNKTEYTVLEIQAKKHLNMAKELNNMHPNDEKAKKVISERLLIVETLLSGEK